MEFDANDPPSRVKFDGRNYVLMPRAGGKPGKYYLCRFKEGGRLRAKGLHVAIWEKHSGQSVPGDHEIHHKDGNTFNCHPDNLECLLKSVHRSLPKNLDMEHVRANLDKQRALASAWHRSPEGREWHRQNALKTSSFRPGYQRVPLTHKGAWDCEVCGRAFERWNIRKVVCSQACHDRKRRANKKARAGLQSER